MEEAGKNEESGGHAGEDADGHNQSEALNAVVAGKKKASKTGHSGKAGDEDGFAGAFGKEFGAPFFAIAVENVDSVGDADADDKRQSHNVGRVEGNVENPHKAEEPERAEGDGQKSEENGKPGAEVKEGQDGNDGESVEGGFLVASFEQAGVFKELNGSAGDYRRIFEAGGDVSEALDEGVLMASLPKVFFGIN